MEEAERFSSPYRSPRRQNELKGIRQKRKQYKEKAMEVSRNIERLKRNVEENRNALWQLIGCDGKSLNEDDLLISSEDEEELEDEGKNEAENRLASASLPTISKSNASTPAPATRASNGKARAGKPLQRKHVVSAKTWRF